MSEEEKKAIDRLKRIIERYEKKPLGKISVEFDEFDYNLFKTLLNLIENQQKEIEELKDTRSIFNMGRRSYKNEIEDKIKAKIEEIDIEIQCCEYADDDTEEYKQDIEKEKRRLLRDKAVLQSLLEEE